MEYPFNNKEIYPLEKVTSTWKTINNEIIESEYPLLQAIKSQPSTDLKIKASPYNKKYNKTSQDSKPSRKPKYKKLKKKDNVCWK